MPSIHNTTKRPLAISLPGGKKLRLGPRQTGQVAPKALEHPPLKKMIEAGEVEVADEGRQSGGGGGGSRQPRPGRRNPAAGGIRHTGDR